MWNSDLQVINGKNFIRFTCWNYSDWFIDGSATTLFSDENRFSSADDFVFTGIFGPNSFSFVAPFLAEFNFGQNFGIWGVQIITMEGPAHSALFQPIWNHPAGQKGRKRKKNTMVFGSSRISCAGKLQRSASSHFIVHFAGLNENLKNFFPAASL